MMRILSILSQLGKISSDYTIKAGQTQSSPQILLIQTSSSALNHFKPVPSLWFSLCTVFSWLWVSGIIWVFQTYINQCEMPFFFKKIEMKVKTEDKQKRNQRQKNLNNFKTV